MNMEKHLSELKNIKQKKSWLMGYVKQLVKDAGTERSSVSAFDSKISVLKNAEEVQQAIAIDMGGTNTRVCFYKKQDADEDAWVTLFEVRNDELLPAEDEKKCFAGFLTLLAQKVEQSSDFKFDADIPLSCVLVWSNAAVSKQVKAGFVTGLVADKEKYTKGEWFITSLSNGDDIGSMLFTAFEEQGITFKGLVIGNDTPLTLCSVDGAHAGMVLSTGVNVTLIKNGKICNAEMGRGFRLPEEFILDADILGDGRKADNVEHLIAGKFLPYIFESHIIALSDEDCPEFKAIAAEIAASRELGERRIKMRQMAGLVNDLDRFCAEEEGLWQQDKNLAEGLQKLAIALIDRAAVLASLTAYASVCELLDEANSYQIALDSRLCRGIPYYLEAFQKELAELDTAPSKIKLELVLPKVCKEDSISVPIQGGVRALSYV